MRQDLEQDVRIIHEEKGTAKGDRSPGLICMVREGCFLFLFFNNPKAAFFYSLNSETFNLEVWLLFFFFKAAF